MLSMLRATAGLAVILTLAAACKPKPPRQAEVDDALSDKGSDMATGEDARNGNVNANAVGATEGVEKMHAKCCIECKAGLAKDRTGAAASTITCADFTDTLDPLCLEHFRGKKTMASECK